MSPHRLLIGALAAFLASCGGGSEGGTEPPPPGASKLILASGGGQHARISRALPTPVVVRAISASGSPVAGISVIFTVAAGSVEPSSATTDASGQASTTWTLGLSAGEQTLTARLVSGAGEPLTVAATADPALAVTLSVIDGDAQQAVVGTATLIPPTVLVRDAGGVPMAGVRLRFQVRAGGGQVTGNVVTTDLLGRAAAMAWVLGAAQGAQQLEVVPADVDVVLTAPVTFSATAVAAGGFVTYPPRSYSLASATMVSVVDSATGARFVFPQGAHGSLRVAWVAGGPVLPGEGAVRFRASFTGPEIFQVAVVRPPDGAVDAFFFGQLFEVATSGTDSLRWWGIPSKETRGDTVYFDLPAEDAASLKAASRSMQRVPRRWPKVQAYGVTPLPPTYALKDVRARLEVATAQTLDWWQANLPLGPIADRFREARAAHPYKVAFGSTGDSWYEPGSTFAAPTIYFNISGDVWNGMRHEPSHYATHLLLGSAGYDQLLGGLLPAAHIVGRIALGFRGSLIEEYCHFATFMTNGDLERHDLRSLTRPGVPELFDYRHQNPHSLDFPSLEGFGAAMLAALTRRSPDTQVFDWEGTATEAPALGIATSRLLEALSDGPQNPDQLRERLQAIVGEPALAAVLEPLGWSYFGQGQVVDAKTGAPLENVRIQAELLAQGRSYVHDGLLATDKDGRFTLPRLFPGFQVLRLSRDENGLLVSREVPITVPWSRATTAGFNWVEGQDGPIRVDFSALSRSFFWSDTYFAFSLPGNNSVRAEGTVTITAPEASLLRQTYTPGGYVPQYIEFARLPVGAPIPTQAGVSASLRYENAIWRAAEGADLVEYELEGTGCRATWKPVSGAEQVVGTSCSLDHAFVPGSEGGTLRIYATYSYKRTVLDDQLRPTSQVQNFAGSRNVIELYIL